MKKIQYLKDDPSTAAKNELIGVWGIGPSTADDLISKGIDSVEKLRQNEDLLNENQTSNESMSLMKMFLIAIFLLECYQNSLNATLRLVL